MSYILYTLLLLSTSNDRIYDPLCILFMQQSILTNSDHVYSFTFRLVGIIVCVQGLRTYLEECRPVGRACRNVGTREKVRSQTSSGTSTHASVAGMVLETGEAFVCCSMYFDLNPRSDTNVMSGIEIDYKTTSVLRHHCGLGNEK